MGCVSATLLRDSSCAAASEDRNPFRQFRALSPGSSGGRQPGVHTASGAGQGAKLRLRLGARRRTFPIQIQHTLSQNSSGRCPSMFKQHRHLCAGTHDHNRADFPLVKAPIQIKDQAWICSEAFVGPGVTVGQGAVVGARAVATKDVVAAEIVADNPARRIGWRKFYPRIQVDISRRTTY
jgi:hypothetical protein